MTNAVKKRLSAAERKSHFIDAAAKLVLEGGTETLTMERLALACGVNKALPYRYFRNRDDVLVALYQHQNALFDAELQAAIANNHDFESALNTLVNTWSAVHKRGDGLPSLQESRTVNGELEALRIARTQSSIQFIAELIGEHHRISKQNAILAASVLFAGSRGLTAIWEHTNESRESLNKSFVKMALGAIAAVSK